jgi:uncharacterized protein (UPF0332 family)
MTREQAALLKKSYDSLRGAKLLAGDGLQDFAASRAYYTMFYVAEALLLGEGLSFSKHTAVIAAFGRRFARTGVVPAEFHRYLIDGQDMRTVGDYSTGPGLTTAQAGYYQFKKHRYVLTKNSRRLDTQTLASNATTRHSHDGASQ